MSKDHECSARSKDEAREGSGRSELANSNNYAPS
jgi:hypothetical protein